MNLRQRIVRFATVVGLFAALVVVALPLRVNIAGRSFPCESIFVGAQSLAIGSNESCYAARTDRLVLAAVIAVGSVAAGMAGAALLDRSDRDGG